MARVAETQVITANDLLAGHVIYFTASGTWCPDLAAAEVLSSAEADARLNIATRDQAKIVGAYLAEVTIVDGVPVPVHFRETFRTRGPSNRPDLGKQAEAVTERAA